MASAFIKPMEFRGPVVTALDSVALRRNLIKLLVNSGIVKEGLIKLMDVA